MKHRLIAAWPLERLELWLSYADGLEGAVDLEEQLPPRALEPLRDAGEFRRLQVDRDLNLLVWPAGICLDAATLHRSLALRRRRPGGRRASRPAG